ncbi:MAG: DNA-processing protein DprA [Lachnospiraceae bacterium]|nr:DNA-processing protein DprA [Lachnospiraceae bacterium]
MTEDIIFDYWWACLRNSCFRPMTTLLENAGSSRRIFEMNKSDLIKFEGINSKTADIIIKSRDGYKPEKEYEKFQKSGIRFIPHYSGDYPKRLKNIKGHPFALFVKGKLPQDSVPSAALIGARNCSQYGRSVAADFGRDLAKAGVSVISGMAYGIDGISQMSCLDAKGKSYGVLGCGIDICYPPGNRILYERLEREGGLISEYPPKTPPKSNLFPVRNRIISALSDIVVVIEARSKSGTGITVDMALDQGKDIAIVPGRITDPLSEGCINFWKQGAFPVASADDILDILIPDHIKTDDPLSPEKEKSPVSDRPDIGLSKTEAIIYSHIDLDPKNIEEICIESSLEISELIEALMGLLMKGLIKELGKDTYVKN